MSIENPISTIRKAIEGDAKKLASTELLDKPEYRHYKAVFNQFKALREQNPEMLERMIIMSAKTKELKDELGQELDAVLQQAFNKAEEKYAPGIVKDIDEAKGIRDSVVKRGSNSYEKLFDSICDLIKIDSSIIEHFKGKEPLLHKALGHTKEAFSLFMESIK